MALRLSGELDRMHRLIRAQSITRRDGRLFSTYRFRHIQIQKYLYSSLDEVERVHLHERFGTLLEEQYRSQDESAAVAVRLARHFQEARITEKAMHYLFEAGNRALRACPGWRGWVGGWGRSSCPSCSRVT